MKLLMERKQVNDAELLLRYRNGDGKAFDEFYERHKRGLYHYCRGILGDEDAALEAMQTLFSHLFTHVDRYLGADNIRGYLYGAASKVAAKTLRTRARDHKKMQQAAQRYLRLAPQESGSEEEAATLSNAIIQLSELERELVMLHVYENFTFKELEELKGVSQSTLYKQYRKALDRLKTILEQPNTGD